MEDQLVEFLRSKKEHSPIPEIDWEAKKDAWVRSVEGLYELVQEMLRESIAAKDVIVRTINVDLSEDFIGTYSIPALELSVGSERVEFRPKGVLVYGAAGRVDIHGECGELALLKDMAGSEDEWTIVLQRAPHRTTAPLNRESLKGALERVMQPLP